MLQAMSISAILSCLLSNLSPLVGVLGLVLCLAFLLYRWRYRAYSQFPSTRLDASMFLQLIMGRIPKDVPFTSFSLREIIRVANMFKEEGICVAWFVRPYIFVYGEQFTKTLINEVDLVDRASPYEMNNVILGNGLFTSKHELWKGQRKLFNPAFNLSALKGKIPNLNRHAISLVEKLQGVDGKPLENVLEILKLCSVRIMADAVLGIEVKNERHETLIEDCLRCVDSAAEQIILRMSRPWLYWNFLLPYFPSGRKYLKTAEKVTSMLRETMKEGLKNAVLPEKDEEQDSEEEKVIKSAGDILYRHYLEDPNYTEQDVRDNLGNLAAAGYDTISTTMMWSFYILGHHPEAQEKAYKEIMSVVPEGDVTYDHISNLKYLDCVIKETLRMYTTVPLIGRTASKEIKCGQYTIPKGAEVIIFLFVLHKNPNIYPLPEKFDPERFSDSSKIRPWVYLPFSEGYRNCIGKRLAMIEMKVLFVHVLRRFKITSLNKIDDSELDWTVVLTPTKPIRLLFETRHSS